MPPLLVLVCTLRPIGFESQRFSHAEKNCTIGGHELIAVVQALHTWYCYSEGVDFVVVTYHDILTYLKSQEVLSRHHTRWL